MRSARLGVRAVLVLGFAVLSAPPAATAKSVTVSPGQSIQAAVDAATPGDTITVMPGDYIETHPGTAAVRITKPLKLVANSQSPKKKVRILPGPGQMHGILVEPANDGDPDIDGLEINGFTVEGFSNMGIWLRHVKNFTIENNESINNLENGIFPTLSANGLVKKNVSYGSQDSALWVEASENVRVVGNDLHNSPTGLEITISKEITVEKTTSTTTPLESASTIRRRRGSRARSGRTSGTMATGTSSRTTCTTTTCSIPRRGGRLRRCRPAVASWSSASTTSTFRRTR